MFKKKSKKPLYMKKSKAAKQKEEEYNGYLSEATAYTEPQQENYKSPRRKIRERRNREYEYSEFEDQYDDRPHGYNYEDDDMYPQYNYEYQDSNMYEMDSQTGMYEYTTEESMYERRPGRMRRQIATESVYTEDSDSDCEICNKRRRQRNRQVTDDSEYTSMYDYPMASPRRKHVHKHGHKKRKRGLADTTESERDPYRKNYNVYVAHQPAEQGGFTYKQQRDQKERGRDTTQTETELVSDEEEEEESEISIREPKKQQKYQVYAAQAETGGVFEQKSPRERVMSVIDYNGSVPMMGIRDKSRGATEGVVYLPVIVMDNTIKLPNSKIISPESLIVKSEEKAEKPLETTQQIYQAADLGIGQGNIFEHARKDASGEILASGQDMTVYSLKQKQQSPLEKQKSTATIASKTEESKPNLQSEYPVQKSYINVAPQKHNTDATASHTNLKPTKSRASVFSRIRHGGPKSAIGTGKDNAHKKEKKNKSKTQKDDGSSGSPSEFLSVVNPTNGEIEKIKRKNAIIPTKNSEFQSQNLEPIQNQVIMATGSQQPGRTGAVNNKQGQTLEKPNTRKSIVGDIAQNTRRSAEGESTIPQQNENVRQTLVGEITLPTQTQNIRKSVGGESAPLNQDGRKSIAGERKSEVGETAAPNQDRRNNVIREKKSIVGESKSNIGESISAHPELKSTTEDRRGTLVRQKSKFDERKQSIAEERNRPTSRDRSVGQEATQSFVVNDQYHQAQVGNTDKPMSQPLQRTSSVAVPEKKKSVMPRLFGRKKRDIQHSAPEEFATIYENNYEQEQPQNIPENQERYDFQEVEPLQPAPVEQTPIKQKRMLRRTALARKSTVDTTVKVEIEKKPELPKTLTYWGYNLSFLIYVFQTAKFFLGLSLHDKLIEVLNTFQPAE